MASIADKATDGRWPPRREDDPIRVGGVPLGPRCHICAFFHTRDEEYSLLLPFVKDGFESGEKVVHTIDPARRDDHVRRLAAAGIDVDGACERGQLELCDWTQTHLIGGEFRQDRTLAHYSGVAKAARDHGFPLARFVSHMEWALEDRPGVGDLLEYEAKANSAWMYPDGLVDPVICTYDLTKFRADVVIDVMRTHPMIIVGGMLQENPFFVPPERFLKDLNDRRLSRMNR